jgi:hypothetical protein
VPMAACQSTRGPSGGQSVRIFSDEMPLRSGPRHCGQSAPGELERRQRKSNAKRRDMEAILENEPEKSTRRLKVEGNLWTNLSPFEKLPSAMPDVEPEPYRVNAREGRFEVLDRSNRVMMVCHDEGSATNYADLLNQAYRQGYKSGYREAKKK